LVALDLIADLDVVVVAHADAALGSGAHLRHVVLEPPQRLELALVDHDVVAQHADRILTPHVAVDHHAAGDVAELRRAEDLAHFREAHDLLADLGREHAGERRLDVIDGLVDHAVVADVDAGLLDRVARACIRADVEADDDRVRRRGKLHVGLGDTADVRADYRDLHVVRRQLLQRIAQRLRAAVHVGLDQHGQGRGARLAHLREDVVELRGLLLRELDVALAALPELRDLARLALVGHDEDVVAGGRRPGKTQHDDRHRRTRAFDRLSLLVEHRADAAVFLAGEQHVADLEPPLADEHGRDGAAAPLETALDHDAGGRARVRRRQLEQLGLQQQRVEQLVDALAGMRRYVDEQRVAAPILWNDVLLRELVADAVGVRVLAVDLVDRDDERHLRGAGVLDRLDRLRHHAVVGGDHEHDDIRDLRAAGAHRGERRVAGRIEERDRPLRRLHVIRADVLRDAARLAGRDARAANVVEQRGLAVVHVAHHGHNRRTRHRLAVCVAVDGLEDLILEGRLLQRLRGMAELLDDEGRRVLVDHLIDRDHHAHAHQRLDDLGALDGHPLREIADADRVRDLDLADHRRGRPREAVLGIDADLHGAAPIRALLLAPAAHARCDVQRVIGAGLTPLRLRRRRGACALLSRLRFTLALEPLALLLRALLFFLATRGLVGRAVRLLVGALARFRLALGRLALLGLGPLARFALGLLASLRFPARRLLGLALLALGALGGLTGLLLGSPLRVELFLLLTGLLLEHVPLDVRALAAHLDADRARAPLPARELEIGRASWRDRV